MRQDSYGGIPRKTYQVGSCPALSSAIHLATSNCPTVDRSFRFGAIRCRFRQWPHRSISGPTPVCQPDQLVIGPAVKKLSIRDNSKSKTWVTLTGHSAQQGSRMFTREDISNGIQSENLDVSHSVFHPRGEAPFHLPQLCPSSAQNSMPALRAS